jgi:hypothetical protein
MSISATEVSVRNSKRQAWCRAMVLLVLLPLAGCIAHAPGSGGGGGGGGGKQPYVVTVTSPMPAPISLPVSIPGQPASTLAFTATLSPPSSQGVTWGPPTLGPTSTSTATGAGLGTMDPTGHYTAPQNIPACVGAVTQCELQVQITATAVANSSSQGSALVNVHVVPSIAPLIDTIGQGANRQYTASVTGPLPAGSNQTVAWAASGVPNAGGFDTNNYGFYLAPQLATGAQATVTIKGTPNFDQTQPTAATTTVLQSDPVGTISNFQTETTTCPAAPDGTLANATCYTMTVSCDGLTDWTTYLKVNSPPASQTQAGTVLFLVDDGGANLYDTQYTHGSTTVGNVLAAGYTTVQISYGAPFDNGANPSGWLTGPGGVRRLACRFATVANWIFTNPKSLNPNASSTAPMCATGNGGGASAIAYALTEYGLSSDFKMVDLTSGPDMAQVNQGCISSLAGTGGPGPCNPGGPGVPLTYSANGTAVIDAAYAQPTACTTGNTNNTLLFQSDSIIDAPSKSNRIPIPNTIVYMRFGAGENTAAEPQGQVWSSNVAPLSITSKCEKTASHDLPSDPTAAGDIATDITGQCK